VTRERGARLLQCFDHVTLGGLYGDALRGERASTVGGAERMVRSPLLVQACPDEDVIEHALLALYGPQGAVLDEARRDGVQLAPAVEATVGLDHSLKQIAHFSSFSLCLPSGALSVAARTTAIANRRQGVRGSRQLRGSCSLLVLVRVQGPPAVRVMR
jgi:hypothetical protein